VPINAPGLFHTAIPYPTRKDLATIYPLTDAPDHWISEALYLEDPDKNGVELYWDWSKKSMAKKPDGTLDMFTKSLYINDLP